MSDYMKQMIVGNIMVFFFAIMITIFKVEYIIPAMLGWVTCSMLIAIIVDKGYLFKENV